MVYANCACSDDTVSQTRPCAVGLMYRRHFLACRRSHGEDNQQKFDRSNQEKWSNFNNYLKITMQIKHQADSGSLSQLLWRGTQQGLSLAQMKNFYVSYQPSQTGKMIESCHFSNSMAKYLHFTIFTYCG